MLAMKILIKSLLFLLSFLLTEGFVMVSLGYAEGGNSVAADPSYIYGLETMPIELPAQAKKAENLKEDPKETVITPPLTPANKETVITPPLTPAKPAAELPMIELPVPVSLPEVPQTATSQDSEINYSVPSKPLLPPELPASKEASPPKITDENLPSPIVEPAVASQDQSNHSADPASVKVPEVTLETIVQVDKEETQLSAKPDTLTSEKSTPKKKLSFKEEMTWKMGSLMYSKEQVDAIYEALLASENGNLMVTALKAAGPTESKNSSEPRSDMSPIFYLNSIVYFSPTNWTVWINGKRFTYQGIRSEKEHIPSLEIVKVTPQRITFAWRTAFLDEIAPAWQEKMLEDEKGEFFSSNMDIMINHDRNQVQFTLYPNQSFVVRLMEIIEGHITKTSEELFLSENLPQHNQASALAAPLMTP